MIYQYLTLAGLGFGAFAGFIALFRPQAMANTLGLQANPAKPGGFAEFRATFGGVFFMIHLTAFLSVLRLPAGISIFVVLPIAMGWYGAAFGRAASMVMDAEKNGEGGTNRYWIMLELIVGTLIMSIFFQFLS